MLKFPKYNEELSSFNIRHTNKPFMISCDISSVSIVASKVCAAGSKTVARPFRH